MSPQHKLQVKIGSSEFSAEGSEETVNQQFEKFLTAVQSRRADNLDPPPKKNGDNGNTELPADPVDEALLHRVFKDHAETVSLTILPQTEPKNANAMLLIIYGHQRIKGEHDIGAVQLLSAAKQTGLRIDRVDRVLSVHSAYFTKGGVRRGSRYGLNNRGISYCERLIHELVSG